MKQRGRKSRASLSIVGKQPRLVASSTPNNPPPPPDHLEEPEAALWRAIVAEFRGPAVAYLVLADALKAHQRARQCSEIIEAEGYSETGRDGQAKAHHLLAAERSATASYQRQLKALGIKF
jgi:P27 family predicted phage terminase small subunit